MPSASRRPVYKTGVISGRYYVERERVRVFCDEISDSSEGMIHVSVYALASCVRRMTGRSPEPDTPLNVWRNEILDLSLCA